MRHPNPLPILTLIALTASATAPLAEPVDPDKVWSLLTSGACDDARQLVNTAENRDRFLTTPEGQSLYAKSICCSPPRKLMPIDIKHARQHIAAARSGFDPLSPSMSEWLDDVTLSCDQRVQQIAGPELLTAAELLGQRLEVNTVRSNYKGKMMSGCSDTNLSPTLVPNKRKVQAWEYVTPRPKGELTPPPAYLDRLRQDYVDQNPQMAICAPYVAISAHQDPEKICNAARTFSRHLQTRFGSQRPPVWVSLIHYPQQGQQLHQHAEKTSGSISCRGVLGYFDWSNQSLVYRAPAGFFGTFNHELTHALSFWDLPLAPRWFEEGLAALHEHTDANYQGLDNPWREKVLEDRNIISVDLEHMRDYALRPSLLEFESSPQGATVAREYLRRLQRCGALPGLYRTIKAHYSQRKRLTEQRLEPYQEPPAKLVEDWLQMITDNLPNECR